MSETESRGQRPEFSPEVESQHERLDSTSWDNIYVVGDVHGCADELNELLELLSPTDDELLVFVGDLVNKGPDSETVVETVREMENAVSVRGNNEQKVIEGRSDPDLSKENFEFIKSTPIVVSWDSNIVVHGGVVPAKPLESHEPVDLLETRSICGNGYDGTFWFERHERDLHVFFGHTVLDSALDLENAVGLDTGCVYGGGLTAYDTQKDEFVTVEAKDTYKKRSRSHIVSVREVR
jgi:serine/threonine protein phosphatase 1